MLASETAEETNTDKDDMSLDDTLTNDDFDHSQDLFGSSFTSDRLVRGGRRGRGTRGGRGCRGGGPYQVPRSPSLTPNRSKRIFGDLSPTEPSYMVKSSPSKAAKTTLNEESSHSSKEDAT